MLENLDNSQFDEMNDYHYDRMCTEDRLFFEAKLLSNPTLSQQYREFTHTVDILKIQNAENLKNHLKSFDKELENTLINKGNRVKRYVLIATFVVVVLLGIVIVKINSYKSKSFIDDYNERDLGLPVVMGTSTNIQLDKAMSLYKLNDFKGSESILRALAVSHKPNDTINYYIAVNAYEQHDFNSAITYLTKVDSNSSFYYKSLYRKGLSYWQLGRLDDAKRIFSMVSSFNSPFTDKSKAILKIIK